MHLDILTPERKAIFERLPSLTGFYLAGGTAIALQLGHRISVDFDLFTDDLIAETLLGHIGSVFGGREVIPTVNDSGELTVQVSNTKVTFLRYPFPVLRGFVDLAGLPTLSIPELAATKAYTIGRRGSLKDYVDLHAIVAGRHASLAEITDLASQKYGDLFNTRLFFEQLIWLDDVEDEPIQFIGSEITRQAIQSFFTDKLRDFRI